MALRQNEVLAFLDDLTTPFGNNQAERDLRGFKVQQNVSGCFCSDAGADAFACLHLMCYNSAQEKTGKLKTP
ncbi:MAG: transposase [Ktedonobacterales bacterium]